MKLSRSQMLMLGVLIFGTFITMLNQTVVTPALPSIMKEMNIGAATAQWLTTGFTLVNAIMIPISAYLTEHYSTRRLFLVSMSFFTAGSLLAGWGPQFAILLGGRLVQALGAGILMPMVMTVLVLTFPVDRRGAALGVFGLVVAFAPAVGPTVAGLVIDHASWHLMFYLIAALAVAVSLLACFTLKPALPSESEGEAGSAEIESVSSTSSNRPNAVTHRGATLDRPSVILSTLGFGGLLYGFSDVGANGVGMPAFIASCVGLVSLFVFAYRQLTMEHPMLNVRVLKSRKFLVGTAVGMIVQASLLAAGILMPIYVQTLLGYSAVVSGLVLLPGALVMGAMGPVAGHIFDRHGPRRMAIVGMVGLTLSTFAFALLNLHSSLIYITVLYLVRMFSLSLVNMPLTTWAMNSLDNDLVNHGTSMNNTLRQVAGSLGTAIVISISAAASSIGAQRLHLAGDTATLLGINVAFGACGVLCAIGTVIAIALVKDRPDDATAEDPENAHRTILESIMAKEVTCIRSTASVPEAMALFVEKGIDAMPIVDDAGKAVGFISYGDIMRALSSRHDQQFMDPVVMIMQNATDGHSFESRLDRLMRMQVQEIGSVGVIGVDVHAKLPEVCRVLSRNRVRKVPVLEEGRIVGMINRADIARYAMGVYLKKSGAPTSQ